MKNLIKSTKELTRGVGKWKIWKPLGEKAKWIILLIATNVINYYVNHRLEDIGEPEIAASIVQVMLRKPLNDIEWEGLIYLNVTNLEAKETILRLDEVEMTIPSIDRRVGIIRINRYIQLGAFANKADTILLRLPERLWIKTDSTNELPISVRADVRYPSGKSAQRLTFKFPSEAKYELRYAIPEAPDNAHMLLREASKRNELPPGWAKYDLNFRGKIYDCYYSPSDMILEIVYSGEVMHIRPRKKIESTEISIGKVTMIKDLQFVPHPSIENRFTNLKERTLVIASEKREKDRIVGEELVVSARQGYAHILYVAK